MTSGDLLRNGSLRHRTVGDRSSAHTPPQAKAARPRPQAGYRTAHGTAWAANAQQHPPPAQPISKRKPDPQATQLPRKAATGTRCCGIAQADQPSEQQAPPHTGRPGRSATSSRVRARRWAGRKAPAPLPCPRPRAFALEGPRDLRCRGAAEWARIKMGVGKGKCGGRGGKKRIRLQPHTFPVVAFGPPHLGA